MQKWKRQLVRASADLKREYGLDSGQGVQVSNLIEVYNSAAVLAGLPQVPEVDVRVRLPDFMCANRASAFSNLHKDMAKELTAVERLGGMRDLMSARFVIDDRDYAPPKTEAPEYRWYSSDWKRPM